MADQHAEASAILDAALNILINITRNIRWSSSNNYKSANVKNKEDKNYNSNKLKLNIYLILLNNNYIFLPFSLTLCRPQPAVPTAVYVKLINHTGE